jgi:hypothetical protein
MASSWVTGDVSTNRTTTDAEKTVTGPAASVKKIIDRSSIAARKSYPALGLASEKIVGGLRYRHGPPPATPVRRYTHVT